MDQKTDDCFFTTDDNIWFQPTDHTRGPWHEDHCHAGPPTALLARAIEQTNPQQKLVRITVNLIRPIPFKGFRIEAEVTRQGRIVSTSAATLIDADEKTCATATALQMTPQQDQPLPSHNVSIGRSTAAKIGEFPIRKTLHDKPAFNGEGVAVRYPDGQTPEPGPTIAWMKTVPLFKNEEASAFQRICPLADCGNAFSRNAEPWDFNFMNPDLTILLHRDPVGEWLGTSASGYWEDNGIGMADAQLFDESGSVGRALQTLLIRKT